MAPSSIRSDEHILLQGLPGKGGRDAFLLPVSGFPVPENELARLRIFLRKLSTAILRTSGLTLDVFIQVARLHIGDGSYRFASHGGEWMPEIGLGVWPDREPPRLWTTNDFMDLGPDERPKRLMYQVFRVSTSVESRENARDVMLGLGCVLQILTADDTPALLRKAKETLLPPIKDRSFRAFPYYVPLLDRNSFLAAKSSEDLERWLCGISVYIRESFEDNGLLILSREPLEPILEGLGGRFESESGWRLSL
jgi:hypothetical protein